MWLNVTVEQEWTRVDYLVPNDHPSWASGTIRNKCITHLRVVQLEKIGAFSVSLLSTGPVKEAGTNTLE
jgi:hypothetical protein